MKFAKIVFWIAAIWGILITTPLFFIFDMIGRQDPPPITHAGFYYGFTTVTLAWQVAFIVIAIDPVRYRPIIIPSILEKFAYVIAMFVLYTQHRIHRNDLTFVMADLILGILFVISFLKLGNSPASNLYPAKLGDPERSRSSGGAKSLP